MHVINHCERAYTGGDVNQSRVFGKPCLCMRLFVRSVGVRYIINRPCMKNTETLGTDFGKQENNVEMLDLYHTIPYSSSVYSCLLLVA